MQFIRTNPKFPFSAAVIHSGRTLETVLTGIRHGESQPVSGGVETELREIFRQLDEILEEAGVTKTAVVSARLYLADVLGEIAAANRIYQDYFGTHPPNRRAYGVTLQAGMRIEAAFVAELP
jgi:2-iminobutanoate/2-iminopropanoate deaminase